MFIYVFMQDMQCQDIFFITLTELFLFYYKYKTKDSKTCRRKIFFDSEVMADI